MGDFDGARAFWREARALYESLGVDAGVTEASKPLAQLAHRSEKGRMRFEQIK